MRVLVLSDIHANLTALETVLDAAGPHDAVWCLGDLVGYGPDPNECVELVRSLSGLTCILGNHDAAALGRLDTQTFNRDAQLSVLHTRRELSESNLEFLAGLPRCLVIEGITLAHGSPRNPIWEYLLDAQSAVENLRILETPLCFVGHTHIPLVYTLDSEGVFGWSTVEADDELTLQGPCIINPGSVGQPRDHDPRAAYAIYDTGECRWAACRVGYDVRSVQERIHRAGLPSRHAVRLAEGW